MANSEYRERMNEALYDLELIKEENKYYSEWLYNWVVLFGKRVLEIAPFFLY